MEKVQLELFEILCALNGNHLVKKTRRNFIFMKIWKILYPQNGKTVMRRF